MLIVRDFLDTTAHLLTQFQAELAEEIANCNHQYKINGCAEPVPHLESLCSIWHSCQQRDPRQVERTRVAASTLGDIFESFFDAMSIRTSVSL